MRVSCSFIRSSLFDMLHKIYVVKLTNLCIVSLCGFHCIQSLDTIVSIANNAYSICLYPVPCHCSGDVVNNSY